MRPVVSLKGQSGVNSSTSSKPCRTLVHLRLTRTHRRVVTVAASAEELSAGEDAQYIRQALALARNGLGKTAPNPCVGSIIVKDGKVVGQGYHPKAGQPHAEVFALRAAGKDAIGATAYVTLEPCNHYGRTPPCSRALVAAGVKKVVIGVGDPNPLVGGAGITTLKKAGIEVQLIGGQEEQECYDINRTFMEQMAASSPDK